MSYKNICSIQTQKDVYLFIVRYIKEHGYPQAYSEIEEGINVSDATIKRAMAVMYSSGIIETDHPGTSRAYRLRGFEFRRKKSNKQQEAKYE